MDDSGFLCDGIYEKTKRLAYFVRIYDDMLYWFFYLIRWGLNFQASPAREIFEEKVKKISSEFFIHGLARFGR